MIRKEDIIMENNKKEFTIKELEKQYAVMSKKCKALDEQIKQKKQDEEDRRQAELAHNKEIRKKEVDDAYDNYSNLLRAYIKDYGSYSTTRTDNTIFPSFWHTFF